MYLYFFHFCNSFYFIFFIIYESIQMTRDKKDEVNMFHMSECTLQSVSG